MRKSAILVLLVFLVSGCVELEESPVADFGGSGVGGEIPKINIGPEDFDTYEVTLRVVDENGNPIENANVKAYSEDYGWTYPYNHYGHDYGYTEPTDSNGEFLFTLSKGAYSFFVDKQIRDGLAVYMAETFVSVDKDKEIILKSDQTINFEFKGANNNELEIDEVLVSARSPYASMSDIGRSVGNGFVLKTNKDSNLDFLFFKEPTENSKGYIFLEKEIEGITQSKTIQRELNDLATFKVNYFDNDLNLHSNQVASLNVIDFHIHNIKLDCSGLEKVEILADPMDISYRTSTYFEENSYSFYAGAYSGPFHTLEKGKATELNYGGDLDINLQLDTRETTRMGERTHFWIEAIDNFGNILTYAEVSPRLIIYSNNIDHVIDFQRGLEKVENIVFIGGETYDFDVDFGIMGEKHEKDVLLRDAFIDLSILETDHLEIELPTVFLAKENIFDIYEEMYLATKQSLEVDTEEKIYVQLFALGTNRDFAPLHMLGMIYESDKRNIESYGLLAHEIGHPYTLSKPIELTGESGAPGRFAEQLASLSGLLAMENLVSRDLRTKGRYNPTFYDLQEFERRGYVDWNEDQFGYLMESTMLINFYLQDRFGHDIHQKVWYGWHNTFDDQVTILEGKGFSPEEIWIVLYSLVAGENINWLYRLADNGIEAMDWVPTDEKVEEGLSLIALPDLIITDISVEKKLFSWQLRFTVENIGEVASDRHIINIDSEYLDFNVSAIGLEPGQSSDYKFRGFSSGTITVTADANNDIVELNEDNNVASVAIPTEGEVTRGFAQLGPMRDLWGRIKGLFS